MGGEALEVGGRGLVDGGGGGGLLSGIEALAQGSLHLFGGGEPAAQLLDLALGGIAGLFGLTVGAILLLVHLAGLTSLGVAYLAPFSDVRGWRAVLRPRLSRQKFRDPALGAVDRKNQK